MTRRRAEATTASSGSRSSASRRSSGGDEPRPRRRRAKRGQGEQLREQILDATYELLIETGDADQVSTRAVAGRVGCSSPALYLHFPDRASLLWAACNRQFVKLGELVRDAVAGIDDPVEALKAAGVAYVTFGLEHTEEYRVMMMGPEVVEWNTALEDLPREAGFDVLHRLIEQAMASGALRDDDPSLVALTVWAAVHGIVTLRIAKSSFAWPPVEDEVDRLVRLLTGGLAGAGDPDPDPARPRTPSGRTAPDGSPKRRRASKRSAQGSSAGRS